MKTVDNIVVSNKIMDDLLFIFNYAKNNNLTVKELCGYDEAELLYFIAGGCEDYVILVNLHITINKIKKLLTNNRK